MSITALYYLMMNINARTIVAAVRGHADFCPKGPDAPEPPQKLGRGKTLLVLKTEAGWRNVPGEVQFAHRASLASTERIFVTVVDGDLPPVEGDILFSKVLD